MKRRPHRIEVEDVEEFASSGTSVVMASARTADGTQLKRLNVAVGRPFYVVDLRDLHETDEAGRPGPGTRGEVVLETDDVTEAVRIYNLLG